MPKHSVPPTATNRVDQTNDVLMQSEQETAAVPVAKSPFGVLLYWLIVSLPAISVTLLDDQVFANGWIGYGVTLSGVVAFTVIALQFVLIAHVPWLDKWFGFAALLRLHKAMAVAAILLVVLHMILLVVSRGNWELIWFPLVSWPVQLGRVAMVCLVIILVISFGRRWVPVNNSDWRWFHGALAWLILLSGFVHSFVMGSSSDNLLLSAIWIGLLVVAVAFWGWRFLFS